MYFIFAIIQIECTNLRSKCVKFELKNWIHLIKNIPEFLVIKKDVFKKLNLKLTHEY